VRFDYDVVMRFVPLGVGDAFTALHYSTCLMVEADEADGTQILVDCPHPIQKMMREASLASGVRIAPDTIAAVVLTHLHADHCSGLEGLAYYSFFYLQKKLPLYLHPRVLERLWEGHLAAGMEELLPQVGGESVRKTLDDYFEVHLLDEHAPVSCGPFSLECRQTIHHVPTTALRIRAGHRSLGHSADTAFDELLIDWLARSDLVVHETNYGIHTPYEKLAALPEELRAKMRLIHYPDAFDLQASVIEPLHEGRIYEV